MKKLLTSILVLISLACFSQGGTFNGIGKLVSGNSDSAVTVGQQISLTSDTTKKFGFAKINGVVYYYDGYWKPSIVKQDITDYGKVLGYSGLNLQPVTNRLQMPNQNFFEGAPTVVTYRTRFALMSSTGWVRVIYDNNTYNQNGIHPYTIEASVQSLPSESANINAYGLTRLSFNGQTSAVVYPGKQVISDPVYIGLDPVDGAYIMMRNCVTAVGAVANKWPVGLTNRYPYEGSAIGNSVDTGSNFNYGSNGQQSFAPFMIGSIRAKANSIGLLGNSIADGSGDIVPTRGFGGFLQDKYQVPLSKSSVPGETLTFFNSGNYYSFRYVYVDHATYVMSEYGTNDIGVGRSSVQLRQDLLKFFHDTYRMGKLHIHTTLLPRATSTDNWQTASNQTPWVLDSIRITVNDWLRAGAPCYLSSDGYSATPAPVGSGVPCPWLYKTIDIASAVEVNSSNVLTVNGGRWLIGGNLTTGTATFGATYMLQDASKDFNAIKVSGALLVITGGTGAGQVVQIVGAASPTQINFVSSLSTAPDATSTYRILDIPTVDQVHPTNNFHEKIADYIFPRLPN